MRRGCWCCRSREGLSCGLGGDGLKVCEADAFVALVVVHGDVVDSGVVELEVFPGGYFVLAAVADVVFAFEVGSSAAAVSGGEGVALGGVEADDDVVSVLHVVDGDDFEEAASSGYGAEGAHVDVGCFGGGDGDVFGVECHGLWGSFRAWDKKLCSDSIASLHKHHNTIPLGNTSQIVVRCATLFGVCGYLESCSLRHTLPLCILFEVALSHKYLVRNLKLRINAL